MTLVLSFRSLFMFSPRAGDSSERGRSPARNVESSADTSRQCARDPLIVRLTLGDLAALREIMDDHTTHLSTVAVIITGSPDLAAEAVQDAFVQLWEARERLDPTRPIRGYLTTVTARRANDLMRHERMHTRVSRTIAEHHRETLAATYNAGAEEIARAELDTRVAATIDTLSSGCREVFLLHRDAGLSYAEIESALHLSGAAVRQQMSRAMRAIVLAVKAWQRGD